MRNLSVLFLLAAGEAFCQNPPAPLAHFHHVHLNSTDPQAAVDFYTSKLESEKRKFADGREAVWAHQSWLLFTKVDMPPESDITSAIWHIGWGGGDNMPEAYRNQVESGTKFHTPITDLSDQCDGKGGNGRAFFSYIDAPDHTMVELNTTPAANRHFYHVHLLSADPIAASDWYMKEFGVTRRGNGPPSTEVRYRCGHQTAPSATVVMDDVSIGIYPVGNAKATFPEVWKGRDELESTAGHSVDHLGFRVDNLDQTLERLKSDGVKVTAAPRAAAGGRIRFAFIEGPDRIRLEIVEEHN